MYKCKWCGEANEPGMEFCANCGQQIVLTRPCMRCGADIPIHVRLCQQCGAFNEPAPLGMNAAGNILPPPGAVPAGPAGVSAAAPVAMQAPYQAVPPAYPGMQAPYQAMPGTGTAAAQPVYQTRAPAARRERELWERGPTVDWICWLSLGMAIVSGILYWLPRAGIIFAVVTLMVIAFGGFRYYTLRDEHVHYWLLIVAAVIAMLALVFSIMFTKKAENVGIPGTMLLHLLLRC
jgi:hypothetical protein